MNIDAAQASSIVRSIEGHHTLSPAAAEAIIAVSWLAVDADMTEDADELATLDAIAGAVRERAGIPPGSPAAPVADVPTDDEAIVHRLEQLMASLPDGWSRELAYTFAHVLTVVDFQIQPSEDSFLVILRDTFGIADERAAELAAAVVERLTPGVE